MVKISKKRVVVNVKVDFIKFYELVEVMSLVKEVNFIKFDVFVDVYVCFGVDLCKVDQVICGMVILFYGIGKMKCVVVFCMFDKEEEVREVGVDFVGFDDLIQKVFGGWIDFDVVVVMLQVMVKIGCLGCIFGLCGLMFNFKIGIVIFNVGVVVSDVKGGKIFFCVDKFGIIYFFIGCVLFFLEKFVDNVNEFLGILVCMKFFFVKGNYMKSVIVVLIMSLGIKIDFKLI